MNFFMYQILFACRIDNCTRHRMWEMFLETCGNPQQFIAIFIAEGHNIYHARSCLRQRSGLIKYDRICFCHRLQELATLHRDA